MTMPDQFAPTPHPGGGADTRPPPTRDAPSACAQAPSSLELQQRGLLDLVKNRGGVPEDPYLRRVHGSRELAMVRKIALWWRAFALQAQCRVTAPLLKRLGCFDALVGAYFDTNATSPFVEELSLDFLASLHRHDDPLIRAMAQFEHALLAARGGSKDDCEILFDRNPDLVVLALESGDELPPPDPGWLYRLRVARDLPHLVACTREPTAGDGARPECGAALGV